MDFAARLKETRMHNKLTQAELGLLLDVHGMTISKWERGILLPNVKVILKITSLLDVTSDYLLGIDNPPDIGSE